MRGKRRASRLATIDVRGANHPSLTKPLTNAPGGRVLPSRIVTTRGRAARRRSPSRLERDLSEISKQVTGEKYDQLLWPCRACQGPQHRGGRGRLVLRAHA